MDLDVAFVFASCCGLSDAVSNVFVEETDADALECFGDGADLGEHVDAVFVVVDHALESANLAFDLGESRGVVLFGERVSSHTSSSLFLSVQGVVVHLVSASVVSHRAPVRGWSVERKVGELGSEIGDGAKLCVGLCLLVGDESEIVVAGLARCVTNREESGDVVQGETCRLEGANERNAITVTVVVGSVVVGLALLGRAAARSIRRSGWSVLSRRPRWRIR